MNQKDKIDHKKKLRQDQFKTLLIDTLKITSFFFILIFGFFIRFGGIAWRRGVLYDIAIARQWALVLFGEKFAVYDVFLFH
jgi:hypothetical protein